MVPDLSLQLRPQPEHDFNRFAVATDQRLWIAI
ncbi:hypothetical protein ABIB83_004623 [Bradyrhizobium sp. I1.8.5]